MTNKQPSANTSTGQNSRVLLPDQWEKVPLREVVSIEYGEGLTESKRDAEGEVPVYGSSGVVGHHSQALVGGPCIIVGRKGSSGAVHYSRDACWPIDTTYYIQPPDEITSLYLYYALKSLGLGSLDKSTTIPSLSRDDFYSQPIPIAPFPEQRRIVDAIETQFTRLDAAVAALERAQATVEKYRASVLQAACEGRLVPTEAELARREGRDYEPADELLERILEERRARWAEERWAYEIERAKKKAAQAQRKAAGLPYYIRDLEPEHWEDRTPEEYEPYLPKGDKWKERYDEPEPPDTEDLPELPEGWHWASVDQLTFNIQYGHTESATDEPIGPKFLRITDIQDGKVNWQTVPYCLCTASERGKYTLDSGDIVFARTGATTGKSYLIKEPPPGAVFASYLIRLQFNNGVIPRFLDLFFGSPMYWPQIMTVRKGSTQPGVNATILATLAVPLPPLAEQRRIGEEVERRLSVVEALEKSVEANLARAKRLRQAILKKAFEGRLVPQDPTDEPASVLLERLQMRCVGRGRNQAGATSPQQMEMF